MAEKEVKDTKKTTTKKETVKKQTSKKEPIKKETTKKETAKKTTKSEATKREASKKVTPKKDNAQAKTTKTQTSNKKLEEKPKKEIKKEDDKSKTVKVEVKEAKKLEVPKGKVTVETKKFEIKNNKKDSKNGKDKKVVGIALVILVLAIVASLTFLIITSSDPKKSADGYLTNLKAGDFEKAQEFATGENILSDTDYSEEIQKLLFNKMSWKVKKVTIDSNNATVEMEITNKDFSEVKQNWTKRLLSNVRAVIGKTVDTSKYFEEELKNENLQTKTTTGTIKLEKQDKKWKVIVDNELQNILLPDFENAINYLQ